MSVDQPVHTVLARLLRRAGFSPDALPADLDAWRFFIGRVSEAYDDSDQHRYTTERAFDIASREMNELYDRLRQRSADELAVERDKLRRALALQAAAFDTMTEGVLVIDTERRVVRHNRAFRELWGMGEDLPFASDAELFFSHARALVTEKVAHSDPIRWFDAHPRERNVDEVVLHDCRVIERFSAPVEEDDVVHGRLWIFREVTGQRRAELAERQARQFLDSIVENIPHMIFVKDVADLAFVRFNRAGERLLGAPREELIGKTDHDLFPPSQAAFFIAKDREVLSRGGELEIAEEPIQTIHGERILRTKKIPILDDAGVPRFLLGISHDVTNERTRAEALKRSKEDAEKANRAKSEFLANMSHELRTPLNAIVGFARVLEGSSAGLDERQQDYLHYILVASEHMLTLVNDLLDLRRVEEDAHSLELSAHDVDLLVDAAVGMVRPLLDERRHALHLERPPGRVRARCDARALIQVLVNLLSNAAKYSDKGATIVVRVSAAEGTARFDVSDTGFGIAETDLGELFTYFTKVGAKHRHRMKGSGVGLALTKQLVERMDGTIAVESTVGKGTRFTVTLPLEAATLQEFA